MLEIFVKLGYAKYGAFAILGDLITGLSSIPRFCYDGIRSLSTFVLPGLV